MNISPIQPSAAATVKAATTEFVKGLKAANVTTVRKPRTKSLRDQEFLGIAGGLFGPSGSGKTEFFVQLLCGGEGVPPMRALYVNTDIGAGGFNAIKAGLKNRGHLDKLDNVQVLDIADYEDMKSFLDEPWEKEILDFGADLFFWDGFGSFQSIDLVDYVLDHGDTSDSSDLRQDNLIFSKVGKDQGWEARKRATVRCVDKFCKLKRPDGKPLHRVITMFEGTKQMPNDAANPTAGSKQVLTGLPLLSGFGVFDQIKGALNFLFKTDVKAVDGKKSYSYVTGGSKNLEGKIQGVPFDVDIPADSVALFKRLLEAYKVEG